jgi:hypothetical protein
MEKYTHFWVQYLSLNSVKGMKNHAWYGHKYLKGPESVFFFNQPIPGGGGKIENSI